MRRLLPSSLTGRLVAILVAVVLGTTLLVAVVTSVVMIGHLNGQLDREVRSTLQHSVHDDGGIPTPTQDDDGPHGEDGDLRHLFGPGDAEGTLNARFARGEHPSGRVLHKRRLGPLSANDLDVLTKVPADGRSHVVHLPEAGSFLVRAAVDPTGKWVAGQSTRPVDEAVATLVWWEVALGLAAVTVAVGAGRLLVRRQLRPLRQVAATAHEVTALPLASGEIGTTVRVPDGLTDERTEVGAVGAALNTMLAHVEHALDERHRSEQQVRRFVADASHELRTPLTTIHGYAELSRRTQPADARQLAQAMAKVEAEATRMTSLVEDMLLLARLDAGRPLARDEVDLTRLVLEAVGDARVVGQDHRWRLDLPEEPVTVPGDEQRLHQVLTNLLNNARRHTPPGTSVVAGVRREDSHVVLSVQDDGPGLPPHLVDSAFERFTRGDSARTRESGGAGLGLSLVEAITTAHGGTASVTSRPGRTVFEVRLPVEPQHREAFALHR